MPTRVQNLWARWEAVAFRVHLAQLLVIIGAVGYLQGYAAITRAQAPGDVLPMHVTYYEPTGNPTYSGLWPYPGSAGCSFTLGRDYGYEPIPLFSVFALPGGREVICIDRGLDAFMAPHLDLFCPYARSVCEAWPGVDDWRIPQPVTVVSWGGG